MADPQDVTPSSAGRADQPLVTFALFAYNQEKYVAEAIKGAFSQTYEPLEIILSDDASTDSTYEIMERLVAGYRGPSKVSVRKSSSNRGLVKHMRDVADLAEGHYIIVAAGDDVSLPQRTCAIVAIMQDNKTRFAASNFNIMNSEGKFLQFDVVNDYTENFIWRIVKADPDYFANGSTAAYETTFLQSALKAAPSALDSGFLYNEDILVAAYAVSVGEKPSSYTTGPLINYRILETSLSNFRAAEVSIKAEYSRVKREIFYSNTRLALLIAVDEMAAKHSTLARQLDRNQIERDRRLSTVEIAASDEHVLVRINALLRCKTATELRICIARMFGSRALALARFALRGIVTNARPMAAKH